MLNDKAGFALRWINCLFVPAFVVLPLGGSGAITGLEVGKIIAVLRKSLTSNPSARAL